MTIAAKKTLGPMRRSTTLLEELGFGLQLPSAEGRIKIFQCGYGPATSDEFSNVSGMPIEFEAMTFVSRTEATTSLLTLSIASLSLTISHKPHAAKRGLT